MSVTFDFSVAFLVVIKCHIIFWLKYNRMECVYVVYYYLYFDLFLL